MAVYGILQEKYLKSEPDILYNKDKFDSGEINLCFITGHSGSGKSSMAKNIAKDKNVEYYELDDVLMNKQWFTMDELKEYGDLIYSFFNSSIGNKFYLDNDEFNQCGFADKYDKLLTTYFVKYSINYAKSHKKTKYVIEGIWIYYYIDCTWLDDYAVYIKGTSFAKSVIRAIKRDINNEETLTGKMNALKKRIRYSITFSKDEKIVDKYRKYFSQ